MPKYCRFCKVGKVKLLFGQNKNVESLSPGAFACTNCGFGNHGTILKCQKCDIIYVDEKISQEKVSTFYEVAEDPLYFEEQGAREKTFKRYLSEIHKLGVKGGKLLDVGTNTGLFVKIAHDSGWNALGIEPNKWGARYAKENYRINLVNKPFENGVFEPKSFDVITMWDVIEHFTDPVVKMELIYKLLKPGGMFAFSTVDPESLLAKIMGTRWSWYMEMHKVFLTKPAARTYLEKIGFDKAYFYPHFRYLSLGYLSSRLLAVNPLLAGFSKKIVDTLGISKKIVPFYANDLYNCFTFKD